MLARRLAAIATVTAAMLACAGAARGEAISATELDQAMGGTWEFAMVGTTAGMSANPGQYSRVSRVHFANGEFDKNPLGFVSSSNFRVRAYEAGGPANFESPYALGGAEYPMTFNGTLSMDCTQLSGTFSFCMASGTFTAVREAAVSDVPILDMDFGGTAEMKVHLTIKPDAEVRVHAALQHGDKNFAVAATELTFTSENWSQPQVIELDASKVTHTSKAVVMISGSSLPSTPAFIKLVHPH